MSVIAIDFDNTINDNYSPKVGKYSSPHQGARNAICQLRENGHKIMIFSCNNKEWIEQWLHNHDIPFDYIWDGAKPVCSVYIDDRGVGFRGDWKATLNDTLSLLKDRNEK